MAVFYTNVSTTPITAMECRQYLALSVVQLKGEHCYNRVVGTYWQIPTRPDYNTPY